jgi:hypothetical protein
MRCHWGLTEQHFLWELSLPLNFQMAFSMIIEKVEQLLNGERYTANFNGQPVPNRDKNSNGDVSSDVVPP